MLILASASPRRQELLHLLCDDFVIKTSSVDESAITAPDAKQLVQKLAAAKAAAVAQSCKADLVIGCDTVVDLDGRVLGKPQDKADAERMLRALSGRRHLVHTGVCLAQNGKTEVFVESSEVEFSPLTDAEILAYIDTAEPYDKAGGYAVQGKAARFVRAVSGCYFNIMGLPVSALYRHLNSWQA